MDFKDHWQKVYKTKHATEVSWFQEHARLSLKLIRDAATASSQSIIDVGGGASTLVGDLLEHGYQNVTVLIYPQPRWQQQKPVWAIKRTGWTG